jgi:hypothetical protein
VTASRKIPSVVVRDELVDRTHTVIDTGRETHRSTRIGMRERAMRGAP